ncbi:hypothetical protein HanIR_Chr14g0715611 [Helianthus annuus]|nr:hypothetical protein HanIR_Chr14g0715611 [Helianthus annuus]
MDLPALRGCNPSSSEPVTCVLLSGSSNVSCGKVMISTADNVPMFRRTFLKLPCVFCRRADCLPQAYSFHALLLCRT